MKILYEVVGKQLPTDCRHHNKITYCLNCDNPIRNEKEECNEYCGDYCEIEHEKIMEYVIEDRSCEDV